MLAHKIKYIYVGLYQHRSILNLDLESTERDPIYLGVSYFYLKFLNVHNKLDP